MKRTLAVVIASWLLLFVVHTSVAQMYKGTNDPQIVQKYGTLPLAFEANQGQTDAQVKFLSRGAGYTLFLTSTEAVLSLRRVSPHEPHSPIGKLVPEPIAKSAVLRMKLVGADPKAVVTGEGELQAKSNYFLSNNPEKWRTNIPIYARVRYKSVYPGVDLVFYGHQNELEYDFVLQPGVDPQAVRLRIDGASKVQLRYGHLTIHNATGTIQLKSPRIYQEKNGVRHSIPGHYMMRPNNEVRFQLGRYDRTKTLIIDPVLAYSTYLGGHGPDAINSIAVDSAGNVYATGPAASSDFPVVNPFQSTKRGSEDAFLSKFDRDGILVYSTYLGGTGQESGLNIAVDSGGNAYAIGWTDSIDFPTLSPIQPTNHGGQDVFVTKLNSQGNGIIYSTYLGGSWNDSGSALAVDSVGNAYVAGIADSADFPTANAFQPNYGGSADAFVAKLNPAGSTLIYSTYLGGSDLDAASAIVVDSNQNTYVAGITYSSDFPLVNPLQPTNHGLSDGFITEINASGNMLLYSTYFGGSNYDVVSAIARDASGNIYMTGLTESTDMPTANSVQLTYGGGIADAYISKFNPESNSLIYSTYLGGGGYEAGTGLALDSTGNAYVTGWTNSTDFPVVNPLQSTNYGGYDAFITEISSSGSTLVYSTYLGGTSDDWGSRLGLDSTGSVYVAGSTKSAHFPTTAMAFQQVKRGPSNGFLAKIAAETFVSVSPIKLVFPAQIIDTASVAKRITIANHGSTSLTINNIYIVGANRTDFAETNDCPSALNTEGSCTIVITFTPTGKNSRKGVLAISDSDPASPQAIPLTGTGTVVSLSPISMSFTKQLVGRSSVPKNVNLTNMGGTPLNFTGITVTGINAGDFSQNNTCGTSIAAGASCTITVTFSPTAIGTRKAAVSISDDGGGSPQKIPLSGTGSVVSLAPTNLSFGNQTVGKTSTPQSITLTNVGSTQLNFSGITITGDFLQTNNCGTSISGGASCTISVTFKPKVKGSRTAALTISDDGGGSPQKVSLTGTGI